MQSTLTTLHTINELFYRLYHHDDLFMQSTLLEMLIDTLGMFIPSIKHNLSPAESALFHNLLSMSSCDRFDSAQVKRAWQRALRWPHAPMKMEQFLTLHVLSKSGLVKGLIVGIMAVPELELIMKKALTPSALNVKQNGNCMEESEWFWWPEVGQGRVFSNAAHLRAVCLANTVTSDNRVKVVLAICEDYKGMTVDQLEDCFGWALSPALPRPHLVKAWALITTLLEADVTVSRYSCDNLLPFIHRQIERVVKKKTNLDCLPLIVKTMIKMKWTSGIFLECLLKACTSGEPQVIRVVSEWLLECGECPDRFVPVLAPGLFSEDESMRVLVAKVIQSTSTPLSTTMPFPFDDQERLERSVCEEYWCELMVEYGLKRVELLTALSTAPCLTKRQLQLVLSALAERIVENEINPILFDRLLSCQTRDSN